jgi:hypothetical protein
MFYKEFYATNIYTLEGDGDHILEQNMTITLIWKKKIPIRIFFSIRILLSQQNFDSVVVTIWIKIYFVS